MTTPTGDTSPAIVEGDVYIWKPKTKTLCEVIYTANPAIGGRPLIFVAVAPTAAFDADELAPSGTWNIEITNIGSNQVVIDAWVQRNDTPFGWPILGRQARFEDPNYVRFDNRGADQVDDTSKSYVKRADTINAIATGAAPVVSAGCRLSDLAPANYSGAGIIIGSGRGALDPDVMALSDDSKGCPGILAAGTRSSAVYAMDGTSVAAPQIARWIWKRMLAGLPSDPIAVETQAANEENSRMRPTTPKPTAARGGAGRIDDQAPKRKVDRFTIWPVL